MHTIAIIGAGFSGSLVAVHLLRKAAGVPVRVVLFERSGAFGPGLAYGKGSESLLLNVVAGRMSALADAPDDFIRWARTKDPKVRGEMFLPRRLYGRYLADLLDASARRAGEAGVTLERIADEVVDIRETSEGVVIERAAGAPVTVARAVLALGNSNPPCPSWCDAALAGSGRYVGDPWAPDALARVGAEERVLIVGTGLTMMDVVLSLREAGHRGQIDAVSRRGLLPQAHRPGNPSLARLPDPLFRRTFRHTRELLAALRQEARHAEATGGDWRDAVNALRSITPAIWRAMDERERRRFLEHLLPFWNTHRHRAPPSVASGVARLMLAERLRVHAACVVAAAAGTSGVRITLQKRGERDRAELEVDRVINCTGPAMDPRAGTDGLTRRLLAAGLVRPGPLSLGVDFDDAGRVINAAGVPNDRLYLMGPARVGRLWETTAVPELRVQAAELAAHLAAQVPRVALTPDLQVKAKGVAGEPVGDTVGHGG